MPSSDNDREYFRQKAEIEKRKRQPAPLPPDAPKYNPATSKIPTVAHVNYGTSPAAATAPASATATATPDAMRTARMRLNSARMRNREVLSSLPPGPSAEREAGIANRYDLEDQIRPLEQALAPRHKILSDDEQEMATLGLQSEMTRYRMERAREVPGGGVPAMEERAVEDVIPVQGRDQMARARASAAAANQRIDEAQGPAQEVMGRVAAGQKYRMAMEGKGRDLAAADLERRIAGTDTATLGAQTENMRARHLYEQTRLGIDRGTPLSPTTDRIGWAIGNLERTLPTLSRITLFPAAMRVTEKRKADMAFNDLLAAIPLMDLQQRREAATRIRSLVERLEAEGGFWTSTGTAADYLKRLREALAEIEVGSGNAPAPAASPQ